MKVASSGASLRALSFCDAWQQRMDAVCTAPYPRSHRRVPQGACDFLYRIVWLLPGQPTRWRGSGPANAERSGVGHRHPVQPQAKGHRRCCVAEAPHNAPWPLGALPRCMRPEPVQCVAPDPWRSHHSITRPCVSARGSSNGQVAAHVAQQRKPGGDLSH
jgi:hypothetical protein